MYKIFKTLLLEKLKIYFCGEPDIGDKTVLETGRQAVLEAQRLAIWLLPFFV
jgi:hypothetical protein